MLVTSHLDELSDKRQEAYEKELASVDAELTDFENKQSSLISQLTEIEDTLAAMTQTRENVKEQQPGGQRKRAASHQSLIQDSATDGSLGI